MSGGRGHYPTPRSVKQAIKSAASTAGRQPAASAVTDYVRQTHMDRLLCRVFSEPGSTWMLKGGTGMLARVPSTRKTLDIDLAANGYTLEEARADLVRLAAIDLGDYFRFQFLGAAPASLGENQPYLDGCVVQFDVFIGAQRVNRLKIDLVTGAAVTGRVEVVQPGNRLPLPRLVTHPYRLYPLADQLADKVCATMETIGGHPSSRQKDLVDLVVAAVTPGLDIVADDLHLAIVEERRRRRLQPFDRFTVPPSWGQSYATLARPVPACEKYRDIAAALDLMSLFIDPVLQGEAVGRWSAAETSWS